MNDSKDTYKEVIGNKFNELSKHQQEVNLYIYNKKCKKTANL